MSHKSVDYKLAAIKDYLKYKNFSEILEDLIVHVHH